MEKFLWNLPKTDKNEKERLRLIKMSSYENEAKDKGIVYVAGIDEVGRGPLAGPVFAACVILPNTMCIPEINDSKKLSENKREKLYIEIKEKATAYALGSVDEKTIDEINILNATKMAMKVAVEGMNIKPELLLIDSVHLDDVKIDQISMNKGDSLSVSIAAASIMAKVTRDRIMIEIDEIYPEYGFARNKGYGTKEHIEAIRKYGPCPIHRRSFIGNFTK